MTPQVGGTDQDRRANRRGSHERPPVVLRQPAVAHLVRSLTVSDHGEDMLDAGAHRDLARLIMRSSPSVRLPLRTVLFLRSTAPGALVRGVLISRCGKVLLLHAQVNARAMPVEDLIIVAQTSTTRDSAGQRCGASVPLPHMSTQR